MVNKVHRLIDVDIDDKVLRTFILLIQTTQIVIKYTDANLYIETRLSTIKLIVLRVLASNGPKTPSEIAEWTQTERHNITALVSRMKRDGLVTSEPNSSDKRFMNITITDKGREVLSQAMPVAKKIVNQVMSSFSEAEAIRLEKALGVLRQNAHQGIKHIVKARRPK